MFTEKQIALAPKVNEVLKKLGWEWKPNWKQDFIDEHGNLQFVVDVCSTGEIIDRAKGMHYPKECILILHWETIEKILYELDYETGGPWWATKKSGKDRYEFGIFKPIGHWTGVGEARQTSVMEAVLDLGNRPGKK